MIKAFYDKVAEFSKTFDVRQYEMLSFVPSEVLRFRVKLIEEEEREYLAAKSSLERLDALCDLLYVSLGAAYVTKTPIKDYKALGMLSLDFTDEVSDVIDELLAAIPCQKRLPMFFDNLNKKLLRAAAIQQFLIEPAFNEVHRSNMAKRWTQAEALARPTGWIMEKVPNSLLYVVKDETGKIRKPPSWTPPNLEEYLPI